MKSLEHPSFLTAMNLLSESHEELLVHHSMQGEKLPRRLLLGIDSLAYRSHKDAVEAEDLVET